MVSMTAAGPNSVAQAKVYAANRLAVGAERFFYCAGCTAFTREERADMGEGVAEGKAEYCGQHPPHNSPRACGL